MKNKNSKIDTAGIVQHVTEYVQLHAEKLDKETIAKYVGVALLVLYGISKRNIVGNLVLSIVTGLVTKFMSEKLAGSVSTIPSSDIR